MKWDSTVGLHSGTPQWGSPHSGPLATIEFSVRNIARGDIQQTKLEGATLPSRSSTPPSADTPGLSVCISQWRRTAQRVLPNRRFLPYITIYNLIYYVKCVYVNWNCIATYRHMTFYQTQLPFVCGVIVFFLFLHWDGLHLFLRFVVSTVWTLFFFFLF